MEVTSVKQFHTCFRASCTWSSWNFQEQKVNNIAWQNTLAEKDLYCNNVANGVSYSLFMLMSYFISYKATHNYDFHAYNIVYVFLRSWNTITSHFVSVCRCIQTNGYRNFGITFTITAIPSLLRKYFFSQAQKERNIIKHASLFGKCALDLYQGLL